MDAPWRRSDIDLIVAAQEDHWRGGGLRQFSIESGATRRLQNGPSFTDWGRDVIALPDLDGDGACECAVSALNDSVGAMPTGRLHILPGATGAQPYELVSPVRARIDRLAARARALDPPSDQND